jgi:LPXTG-motif cell wall-anchored protein
MSLAVLVDQEVSWEREKNSYRRVLVPPPQEKLKVIRDLVAGITGFSAERGDQLVIETLPFETTLLLEPPTLPQTSVPGKQGTPIAGITLPVMDNKTMTLIAGGAIGALVLVLAGVILFRRKRKANVAATATTQAALPGPSAAGSSAALPPATRVEEQLESQLAEREALQAQMDAQALSSLKLAPVITKKAEVFAKHLREKIAKEPDISVQILRTWIREDEN